MSLVGTQSSDIEGGLLANWTQLNGVKIDEMNNNKLTVQCILKCGHAKVIYPFLANFIYISYSTSS